MDCEALREQEHQSCFPGYLSSQERGEELAPEYSIVVPAYNEERLLARTLGSIIVSMQAMEQEGEVIVADNDSTDRTAEIAQKFNVTVISEPIRQIARARNAGAAASSGEMLIFIDADTVLTAELLWNALELLGSGQCCGGGALPAFEQPTSWTASAMLRTWRGISRVFKLAAGSFMFCLRGAYQDVGGFDEAYYASEEIHFSKALKRWGRSRGKDFVILPIDVRTSPRKVEWYTPLQALTAMGQLMLMPSRLKSRDHCWLWYEGPTQLKQGGTKDGGQTRGCRSAPQGIHDE